MGKKYLLTLDKTFVNYCKLNEITDVEEFAGEVFKKGFNIVKYGLKPDSAPLREGKTKTNVKEITKKGRTAPPPPPFPKSRKIKEGEIPEPPPKTEKDKLYDE